MAFKDLVKLKLRELEEPKFDESLSGAHLYKPDQVSSGYNLFDGMLIDLKGDVVKKWRSRYLSLILPSGNYLAQEYYESTKWGMYTWNDEIIWEKNIPIHHDIVLTPQNTLITFTKEMHPYKGRNVDFCVIVEFDMKGNELSRHSFWKHLSYMQSFHRTLELDRPKMFFLPETAKRKNKTPWGGNYDYYRLNSIQILPDTDLGRRDNRFQDGNWLISFRHGSMIFILDKDTKKVSWHCIDNDVKGRLEGPHAPHLLENGNMLIFDNGRYRGFSRVIEIDPITFEIKWEYRADNFFTLSQGHVQKLENGNMLVTEGERGRAFELTPDKEIVWEYYHPEKQNPSNSDHPKSYGRRQWIYRMIRYSKHFIESFL